MFWLSSTVIAAPCVAARDEESPVRYAPGQLMIEFRPETIDIPPNPGSKLISVEERAVSVHDVTGRVVARVPVVEEEPGWTEVRWNGRTTRGDAVASGLYFARIESGGQEATVRVLVLR